MEQEFVIGGYTPGARGFDALLKISCLYAQAAPEDQLALPIWMRDIIRDVK